MGFHNITFRCYCTKVQLFPAPLAPQASLPTDAQASGSVISVEVAPGKARLRKRQDLPHHGRTAACFKVRMTWASAPLRAFKRANAMKNADTLRPRTVKQPEVCVPAPLNAGGMLAARALPHPNW